MCSLAEESSMQVTSIVVVAGLQDHQRDRIDSMSYRYVTDHQRHTGTTISLQ